MPTSPWSDVLARAARVAVSLLTSRRSTSRPADAPGPARSPRPTPSAPRPHAPGPAGTRSGTPSSGDGAAHDHAGYPGDFTGRVVPVYNPELDGDADPGEIVWTWVPYEEDFTQGKDRPVLVVGHDGDWLLGLMLTSKDHSRRQRGDGPRWMDIGSGPWDPRGRDSEVRLDRVVRLDPAAVRREGAIMDRALFNDVVGLL
ncbi:type II toxin-antitoxin system PemK/MazF family toxin [Sanguibacter sp. A247]|uniref:type II toxin-antitoxin system PemK/MazF family toxin n=1 Tax=unclassified Sanguibacter TaxID=2645534 RepID=UPI003FD8BD72